MAKLRVLIVEDSLTVRKHLSEVLSADPDIEVVAEAEDGRSAIEHCLRLRPDLITMDMMMPVMTGLAATEYIMAHCPTPILIVSASINRGELFKTYDALAAGAVDVIDKSGGMGGDGEWERTFIKTAKLVAKIRVITHPRGRLMAPVARPLAPLSPAAALGRRRSPEVAAIGASTGGPGAIVEVLRGLPASFQLPILLVLHINEPFGTAFADWLDAQTPRRVAMAKEGDSVAMAAGRVVMAPTGRHLAVQGGALRLTLEPERHSCRPSIDVLFESMAREYGPAAIAALLTGMGRDGAAGLLDIRKAGGLTIAQDEATSVIYGMPREAMLIGAAARILPIGEIGGAISAGGVP
jgi:two-component system chemotaxis response regulator CheB